MAKQPLPLSDAYGLLEPGPVVLLSTAHEDRQNIMTMSWHTMMEFEPPLVGCVVSGNNFSFRALAATAQCVINIPTVELASQVVGCGNTSGSEIDKFEAFDLTPTEAEFVDAPLVGECYANLECRISDSQLADRYNFFILEVLKAWIDRDHEDPRTIHHHGYGAFMVAGEMITLPSKMR